MGLNQEHVQGSRSRLYVEAETTPGTFVRATAAGAIRHLEADIDLKFDRVPRRDAHGGRQDFMRYSGKRWATWRIKKYFMGPATTPGSGSEPDDDVLHRMFWGGRSYPGGTSVRYSLSSSQALLTGSGSLLANYDAAIWMTQIKGMTCEDWKLTASGGDAPMLEFGGEAFDHRNTGYSLIAAGATSATQAVTAGEGASFEGGNPFGSVLQIGAQNNGGTGYRVNSISTDNLVLEASLTTLLGDVVRPYAPSPVTAGSPVAHSAGSLTMNRSGLGAVTMPIVSCEVAGKNNYKQLRDHAFEDSPTDALLGWRELTFKVVVRARRDMIIWMAARKSFPSVALILTVGSAVGHRGVFTAPQAELDVGKLSLPAAGDASEGTIEMTGLCLDTATSGEGNNDAATFDYT